MACRSVNRQPATLESIIARVTYELTRRQSFGNNRYIYAPHIAELGEELREVYDNSKPLRNDVASFARLMSDAMNAKGDSIDEGMTYIKSLHRLETQLRKFSEIPMPQGDDIRRILINIANYAMIAEHRMK